MSTHFHAPMYIKHVKIYMKAYNYLKYLNNYKNVFLYKTYFHLYATIFYIYHIVYCVFKPHEVVHVHIITLSEYNLKF